MPSLTDALAHWHEFYTLLGTASATMVGLLFVAATVGSGVFTPSAVRRCACFCRPVSSISAASW